MNNSEVLYGAADAIERDGWTTGARGLLAGERPHCILGAIGLVAGVEPSYSDYLLAERYGMRAVASRVPAVDALCAYLGVDSYAGIFGWNDTRQSAAPVIEALRASAVIEEAKERAYETTDQPLPAFEDIAA